jgi:hypothetical protein
MCNLEGGRKDMKIKWGLLGMCKWKGGIRKGKRGGNMIKVHYIHI